MNAWRTQGEGLQLNLYNALDESWQNILRQLADDWEQSAVLSLSFTDVSIYRECAFVDGVMKVRADILVLRNCGLFNFSLLHLSAPPLII